MATDIRIVGMSGNAVEPVPTTKLFRYIFHLSERPQYDWKLLYEQTAHDKPDGPVRRKSQIADDTILVELSPEDNKQEQLDLQKEIVAETNIRYDAAQEQVAREMAARAQAVADADAELQRLREEAKNLKF